MARTQNAGNGISGCSTKDRKMPKMDNTKEFCYLQKIDRIRKILHIYKRRKAALDDRENSLSLIAAFLMKLPCVRVLEGHLQRQVL